jgi:AcrR family transcriptional regulator
VTAAVQPLTQARHPLQQRAKDRFEQVLKAADALLAGVGLSGFSIPELALRLGYTRASIYKFFPTPYAVLNELAQRYLKLLEEDLTGFAAELSRQSWIEVGNTVVNRAAAFHEAHPVARLLILGGPLTDDGYRAQELSIQRLGTLLRQLSQQRGILLPREPVDVATQAVEVGTGCFRQSFFRHGCITDAYRKEAAYAMLAYLSRYVGDAASRPRA